MVTSLLWLSVGAGQGRAWAGHGQGGRSVGLCLESTSQKVLDSGYTLPSLGRIVSLGNPSRLVFYDSESPHLRGLGMEGKRMEEEGNYHY